MYWSADFEHDKKRPEVSAVIYSAHANIDA